MNCNMTPQSSKIKQRVDFDSPFFIPPTPLLHKVGYGTGASVYRLERSPRSGLDRSPWALKKVNRKFERGSFVKERLQKEAEILKNLNHPNIVGFRGFTTTEDGREVLVMEECTQSLGDVIEFFREKEFWSMTPKLILKIVSDISNALHYLHTDCKLIHGDIKSYNILIKENFQSAKLCDFGVTLAVSNDGSSKEPYVGTICWSPPEALMEEGPITIKADIFALGLTLYEMLALEPPHCNVRCNFSATSDSSDDEETYGKRMPLPEHLGSEYSEIIFLYNWCTEEDYMKRPTAKDILDFIESADT